MYSAGTHKPFDMMNIIVELTFFIQEQYWFSKDIIMTWLFNFQCGVWQCAGGGGVYSGEGGRRGGVGVCLEEARLPQGSSLLHP